MPFCTRKEEAVAELERQDNLHVRLRSLDVSTVWIDENCVEEAANVMAKLAEIEPILISYRLRLVNLVRGLTHWTATSSNRVWPTMLEIKRDLLRGRRSLMFMKNVCHLNLYRVSYCRRQSGANDCRMRSIAFAL